MKFLALLLMTSFLLAVSIDKEKSGVCGYDYDYDYCKRAPCLTDNSPYGKRLSTNGKHWYQKYDKTYRVGDKCYKALTRCLGCLNSPSHYPQHLELVPKCDITAAACPKRPKPCHGVKINDKCCEKKNIAVEKTDRGHTLKCCEHGAEYIKGAKVCKEQCFQIQTCEIYKGVEVTDHCAVKSTDELEVAAPCSGPKFEGAGYVCGIQKCEQECKSRPTCHGFTVTSPKMDEQEYDTCWLDMGGKAGPTERYTGSALSKAYKKTCNNVCSDDVKLEWSQKFSPIAAGPEGDWDNECSDLEDTDERGLCTCLNNPEFNDVWSTEKHNCFNRDADMNLYKTYENCKPYRKYKKIGEGWCRPSATECPQGIQDRNCRIPGIYADGEVQVRDGACEKWCNEEVKNGHTCIGYGIRRESSGNKRERCILYGPGMTIGGSVRKAGKGLMKTLGQADGTEGVACYKRVIPKQDRETELAILLAHGLGGSDSTHSGSRVVNLTKMLNYLLEERLD